MIQQPPPTGPRSILDDRADTRRHGSKSTPLGNAPQNSAESEATGTRVRSKQPAIETCADLLRLAYGGKRRINPKKAEIDVLRVGQAPERSEREELLDLATSDRTLARTLELLLFSLERSDVLRLGAQIQEFVGDVLQQHPAFQAKRLEGALTNRIHGLGEDEAV